MTLSDKNPESVVGVPWSASGSVTGIRPSERRIGRELTEDEWKAVQAARAAQEIIGGPPLMPYDITAWAAEVERLRDENYTLRGQIAAARIRLPEQPKHALAILTAEEPPSPLRKALHGHCPLYAQCVGVCREPELAACDAVLGQSYPQPDWVDPGHELPPEGTYRDLKAWLTSEGKVYVGNRSIPVRPEAEVERLRKDHAAAVGVLVGEVERLRGEMRK